VLLGLEAPQDELEAAFAATAKAPIVKGFAVGRTIFVHAAEQWLAGKMSMTRRSPTWRSASNS
jgi:5-dehydro-2-deoxygluconokinase